MAHLGRGHDRDSDVRAAGRLRSASRPLSQACGKPRSSACDASAQTISTPTISCCAPPSVYTAAEGAAEPPILASPRHRTICAAHFAAWAHEIIYVRGGMRPENRDGADPACPCGDRYGRSDAMHRVWRLCTCGTTRADDASRRHWHGVLCAEHLFGCAPVAFSGDAERDRLGKRAIRPQPADLMNYPAGHHRVRKFPARPTRGGGGCSAPGGSIEPWLQPLARVARRTTREARTDRGGEGCERAPVGPASWLQQ
jgi:hypothetical protein